jgi:hypothetical protein
MVWIETLGKTSDSFLPRLFQTDAFLQLGSCNRWPCLLITGAGVACAACFLVFHDWLGLVKLGRPL